MEEQSQRKWKTVEPNIWKPENDGDFIEGTLVTKNEGVGVNDSNTYYLDTKEGIKMVWGSTVLDDRMRLSKIGDYIKVTFKGITKNKRNQDTKIFKLEIAENETA